MTKKFDGLQLFNRCFGGLLLDGPLQLACRAGNSICCSQLWYLDIVMLEFDGVGDAFSSCTLRDISISLMVIKSWADVPSLVFVETQRGTAARLFVG